MQALIRRSTRLVAITAIALIASTASAQPDAIENELKRASGHWRVIEMIDDGRAIPEDQMREWLPGGGAMEIVDYTIIFKSPVDGSKSTRSFRMDPTILPKQIAIIQRDSTTGTGIYEFRQGKLVLCLTNEAAEVPTEFSAPAGSKRMLIVLERFNPGVADIPGMNSRLPQRKPIQLPAPQPKPAQTASVNITQPAVPTVVQRPTAQTQPTPQPVVTDSVAGRVLTDSEVRSLAIGTWRLNDEEGSIDIVFEPSGTFRSYRYYQTMQNFHTVFVPTPISTGTWTVSGGRLIAKITSSTRFERINESFVPAVRSISKTDMILVDHLGRVMRAVRTQ